MVKKGIKKVHIIALVIAVVALILIGGGYYYAAEIVLTKADTVLGIELEIQEVEIENKYTIIDGRTIPQLMITYETTIDSDSYILIDGKRFDGKGEFDMVGGYHFNYDVVFEQNEFGRDVEVVIVATNNGQTSEVKETITLQANPKPDISIVETP